MIYLLHHLIALVLGAGLIMLLLRGTWSERTPGRTIALWHCALLTLWGAAAGLIFGPLLIMRERGIVPSLLAVVRDLAGGGPVAAAEQLIAALPGMIFVLGTGMVLIVCWVRMLRRRRRLRRLLDLVGGPAESSVPAVRIDDSVPAAWCLPGRHPRIVITSATAELLTPAELEAVVLHERAHLRQRHDLALLPFQALRALWPGGKIVVALHRRVQLLTEMMADDHALRCSRRSDLARALTVLAGAVDDPTPTGALGATTGMSAATRARLARLRRPVAVGLGLPTWCLLAAAVAVLATPLSLFLLPG